MRLFLFLFMAVAIQANSINIQDVPKTVTLADGRVVPYPSGVICQEHCEPQEVEEHHKRAAIILTVAAAGIACAILCRLHHYPIGLLPPVSRPPYPTPTPKPVDVPEPFTLVLLGTGLLFLLRKLWKTNH